MQGRRSTTAGLPVPTPHHRHRRRSLPPILLHNVSRQTRHGELDLPTPPPSYRAPPMPDGTIQEEEDGA
jgi:hypothetical protein